MRRIGSGGREVALDLGGDVGMGGRHVRRLAEVGLEIVKFQRLALFWANAFPAAHPHGLRKAPFVEFPIEEFVRANISRLGG